MSQREMFMGYCAIVSKINLRKITLRRINSGGIDVFALHFNW